MLLKHIWHTNFNWYRAYLATVIYPLVYPSIVFITERFHSVSSIDYDRSNIEINETNTWCYLSIFSEMCVFGGGGPRLQRYLIQGVKPLSVTVHYEGGGWFKIVNFCVTYFLNGPWDLQSFIHYSGIFSSPIAFFIFAFCEVSSMPEKGANCNRS